VTAAVSHHDQHGGSAADAPYISGGTGADEQAELAKETEYNLKILAAKSDDLWRA
jgi:hypothetical protein